MKRSCFGVVPCTGKVKGIPSKWLLSQVVCLMQNVNNEKTEKMV
ncbi:MULTISPECIES: hypothetical protein [Methanobacterium]|nr:MULTISPECIES: hypothetical protein [Methanobacterium]